MFVGTVIDISKLTKKTISLEGRITALEGKPDIITDNTVTSDSENAVKSKGIYDAIYGAAHKLVDNAQYDNVCPITGLEINSNAPTHVISSFNEFVINNVQNTVTLTNPIYAILVLFNPANDQADETISSLPIYSWNRGDDIHFIFEKPINLPGNLGRFQIHISTVKNNYDSHVTGSNAPTVQWSSTTNVSWFNVRCDTSTPWQGNQKQKACNISFVEKAHRNDLSIHLSETDKANFNAILADYDGITSIKSLVDEIAELSTNTPTITVDKTVVAGSGNAVSGNAVYNYLSSHSNNKTIHLTDKDRTAFDALVADYDKTYSVKSLMDQITSLTSQLTELRSYIDDNFIKGVVVDREEDVASHPDKENYIIYDEGEWPGPEMVLNIISPSNGFIDLSCILGYDNNLEYTKDATLDWGDGSEMITIVGNEYGKDRAKLQHTYNEVNKAYKITIKGNIKYYGYKSAVEIPSSTRNAIISIELPTDNSPIKCITSYGFYDYNKLQSIPNRLFDNCTEVTNFEYSFYNCSSLESIPEDLFEKCKMVANFENCFYNCTSVTSNLPTLWISHPLATHTKCFNNCNKAPNYADAYKAGWATSPAVSLSLNIPSDNFVLDLSQYIKPIENTDEISVDWGDETIETISLENSVQHTYQSEGEYVVEIDGDIEWVEPKTRSIQLNNVIKSVTLKNKLETI